MREHHDTAGDIIAAAIARGDRITHARGSTRSDDNKVQIQVQTVQQDNISIFMSPTEGLATASCTYRLSNSETRQVSEYPPREAAVEAIRDTDTMLQFDGSLQVIPVVEDGEPTNLYDGICAQRQLYVYDEFGILNYTAKVDDVGKQAWRAFSHSNDALELDFQEPQSASTSEMDDPDHAFQ